MRYRTMLLSMAAAALAFLTGPAGLQAQSEGPASGRVSPIRGGTTNAVRTLDGTVQQVDTTRQMLVVKNVKNGSGTAFGERSTEEGGKGGALVFRVPADTRIALDHGRAKLSDLKPGMRVRVYTASDLQVTGITDRTMVNSDINRKTDTNNLETRGMGGAVDLTKARGKALLVPRAVEIEARSRSTGKK